MKYVISYGFQIYICKFKMAVNFNMAVKYFKCAHKTAKSDIQAILVFSAMCLWFLILVRLYVHLKFKLTASYQKWHPELILGLL